MRAGGRAAARPTDARLAFWRRCTHTMAEPGVALHDRVTQYHAAIGDGVSASELSRLESKLMEEARKACMVHNWEEALELFTHALAVSEKSNSGSVNGDAGGRGALVHNIAFCLHLLGEFDAARIYYEQSLECFKKVSLPVHQRLLNGLLYPERMAFELMHGGLNHNRIQLTKERLLDLTFGRKPNLEQLDQFGRRKEMTRPQTAQRAAAAATSSSSSYGVESGEGHTPGWLAVSQADESAAGVSDAVDEEANGMNEGAAGETTSAPAAEPEEYEAADGGGADEAPRDAAEEEEARREWLAYHLATGEFEEAESLVVTAAERTELQRLRMRADANA